MLFVFLALYVVLAAACLVLGITRRCRVALIGGIVALVLAAASLLVWVLSGMSASDGTESVLHVLLSPMPETLLQPASLHEAAPALPVSVIAILELVVFVVLWAIPVVGIASALRMPRPAPRA